MNTIHGSLNGENSFNNNVYFHSTDVFKIDKIETRSKKDKLEHTNDDENDIVKAEKDLNKEAKLEQLTSSEHGEVLKGTESSMARHTVGGPMTGPSNGCTGAGSGPENRTKGKISNHGAEDCNGAGYEIALCGDFISPQRVWKCL